jgi:glycosyltransferase involved in cell wall biosynthesis
MRAITVLCDRLGDLGGAERYWDTVLPALAARQVTVRLFARDVAPGAGCGMQPQTIRWADEHGPPSSEAARTVADDLVAHPPDVVITASVFDIAVLDAVRRHASRWLVRLHDHRAFCPTGDRVYPQFETPCSAPMGAACRGAAVVRGCVHGPRPSSYRAISAREAVRDRIRNADGVLVSSEHMRAICLANGIAPDRVAITPPPLPDAAFALTPTRQPRRHALVFAARLTPRKGLRSLLGALARLAPHERPRLIVAGEGEDEERGARAVAARDGVDVEWRGRLTSAALRGAIDEADAVALPSLWPEPFGLVGIEAQARGRPAVAYRVGAIGEWIGGAGIAVNRGDENALASAIRTVLEERTWNQFSSAALARAQTYRLDAHADRLLGILGGASRT